MDDMPGGRPNAAASPLVGARRELAAFGPSMWAAAWLLLVVVVLLAISPLWETADSYCGTLATNGLRADFASCESIHNRRRLWVLVASTLLALCVAGGWSATRLRRRARVRRTSFALVFAVLLASVAGGGAAAASLVIGSDNDRCGSSLSRLDEHGSYSADRPEACAPVYRRDRLTAALLGTIAAIGLVVVPLTDPVRSSDGDDFRRRRATAT